MCIESEACCYFELRTGTLIIGILELIFAFNCLLSTVTTLLIQSNEKLQAGLGTVFYIFGIIAAVYLILGVKKVSVIYES